MISVPHKSTLLGLDVHKLTIAAGVLALKGPRTRCRRRMGDLPGPRSCRCRECHPWPATSTLTDAARLGEHPAMTLGQFKW